jgi:hypothetical protein
MIPPRIANPSFSSTLPGRLATTGLFNRNQYPITRISCTGVGHSFFPFFSKLFVRLSPPETSGSTKQENLIFELSLFFIRV